MLDRLYYLFHRLISPVAERGEYSKGYWPHRIRQEALKLCVGISEGKTLEVGCGEGLFLSQLADQNPGMEIWGVDNNAKRLREIEKRCAGKAIKGIKLSLQDAAALSFDDEFFDAIVCVNVFFNMASIELVERALNEMKRVCKNSGRIIFDFRNSLNPLLRIKYGLARYYDGTVKDLPLNTYEPKQIEGILSDLGLEVARKRFIGFPVQKIAPVIIIEAKKKC